MSFANWDDVAAAALPAFTEVARAVRSQFPAVGGGVARRVQSQFHPFVLVMGFVRNPNNEFDDVLVSLTCMSMGYGSLYEAAAPAGTKDYIYLEVERGSGETLHLIGPEWLQALPIDPAYWQTVSSFVHDAFEELVSLTAVVVDAVATTS